MPRIDSGTLSCDLLVAGSGLAGLTAAARAASLGLETIVAGSSSTLAFFSGLMDYLGVYPPGRSPDFDAPAQGLELLLNDVPDHPYAKAGLLKTRQGFEFLFELLNDQGLAYRLPDQENINVITAMGTVKASFMVPRTMTVDGADIPEQIKTKTRPLAIAGVQGLPGFSAAQVAGGLGRNHGNVIPVQARLPGIKGVVPPQIMAQLMADADIRNAWISQVRPRIRGAWACGVPAVLGIQHHQKILDEAAHALDCPDFEISCAPPSIPGLRLKQAFESYLHKAGARVLSNTRMTDPVFDGERFTLTAMVEPEGIRIRSRGVILATGRFFGNGLHARRERIVEPLFHLDVAQPVRRSLWHNSRFLAREGHGINQAGIETDDRFRPLDERGRPVYRHLYAVGGILAGNDWARLKSGAGVCIASAVTAVDAFCEEAGHGR